MIRLTWRRAAVPMAIGAALMTVAVGAGCSNSVNGGNVSAGVTTVDVVMREMSFAPDRFTFHVGDTITFHFENEGKVPHEAVIGDQAAQDAAVAAMNAMGTSTTSPAAQGRSRPVLRSPSHPGMGLPNVIYLTPGQAGDITFQFAKPTSMLMECHQAGHLEAGMKATVTIKA